VDRRLATAAVAAGILFFALAALEARADDDPFVGSWRAITDTPPGRGLIQLDVERIPGREGYRVGLRGQEAEFQHGRPSPTLVDRPPAIARDGVLRSSAPLYFSSVIGYTSGDVALAARRDGEALVVDLENGASRRTFRFLPASDRTFARFEVPRLDAAGQRVLDYTYSPPTASAGLESASAVDRGVAVAPLEAMVRDVLAGSSPFVTSLLLMKDGRLVLEEYFHGQEPDQLHIMMSVTKSFTSMLYGIALERGDLDGIDRPVMEYLPRYRETRWARDEVPITARHLLRMANVVGWREFSPVLPGEPRTPATVMPLLRVLLEDDGLDFLFQQPVIAADPDRYYLYNTAYTEVLGAVLSSRVGDLESYAARHLFEPLAIERFSWGALVPNQGKPRRDDGVKSAGAALFLSPRSLLRVGRMVLDGGTANGRQVVPRAWLEESTALQAIPFEPFDGFGPGDGYGYHWWVLKLRPSGGDADPVWVVAARGNGGQKLFVIPAFDAVFVATAVNYRDVFQTDELLRRWVLPALAGGGEPWELLAVAPDDLGHRPLVR
jgi:CubicO group peptidase (beta-lactamase class C family)